MKNEIFYFTSTISFFHFTAIFSKVYKEIVPLSYFIITRIMLYSTIF